MVANRLLDDHLFLTALELHMELVESGRELSRLRDFFSNPANFERGARNPTTAVGGEGSPPRLARAASVQTFDSIDFARYSDDGERAENDRVAVLEFELRNAQDTIRQLRTALTKTAAAASDLTPTATEESAAGLTTPTLCEPAQPYERRAINFLVHEYLLQEDYKLTSVTFSEENASQDFEVGWLATGNKCSERSCHRWLHATHCIMPIMLYTKVDAKCDEQVAFVSLLLIILGDGGCFMPIESGVWGRVPERSTLISFKMV